MKKKRNRRYTQYRRLINFLKREFPVPSGVTIHRLRISQEIDGDCSLRGRKFFIRIDRHLREHEAIDTLIHEYAHVLSWHQCSCDDHCDAWGKAYSRIYRRFLEAFLSQSD